jgi:hypothetical protein
MAPLVVSHSLTFGRHFNRDEYCDAWLTRDGVTLLPVHRNILAGVSTMFRKMFDPTKTREPDPIKVPLVDFSNLKRVIHFIYDGRVEFIDENRYYDEFQETLKVLKVDLDLKVSRLEEKKPIIGPKPGDVKMEQSPDISESLGSEGEDCNKNQVTAQLRFSFQHLPPGAHRPGEGAGGAAARAAPDRHHRHKAAGPPPLQVAVPASG